MIFEKAKSHGISANSYFVGSDENAFVIDPRRDCSVYIETAAKHGIKITHIFETHRNEDFATGALELANATGAQIYHGPGLDWGYGSTLTDNQTFLFGNLRVTAIYTPGHTDESVSFVVTVGGLRNHLSGARRGLGLRRAHRRPGGKYDRNRAKAESGAPADPKGRFRQI